MVNLTQEAKIKARELNELWDNHGEQHWGYLSGAGLSFVRSHNQSTRDKLNVSRATLEELSLEGLISFDGEQVILLQSLRDAVEVNFGDGKQMSLSGEAMESGKYLVEQLKLKHIDRSIELTEVTAMNDRTRQHVPVIGVHSNEFELPDFGYIEELEAKSLVRITHGRTIKVLILEDLIEAVNKNFIEETSTIEHSASSIFGKSLTSPQFQVDVFMVMPFKDELKPIYDEYIKPLVEQLGYSIKRGDEVFAGHFIPREIYSLTFNSKLVIADCTGQNANVYYELGIAHMLDKKAILIAQNPDDIRFDVNQMRYLTYNPEDMAKFEKNLTQSIKLIMDE